MPPQPLSRVAPKAKVSFDPAELWKVRHLTALPMMTIAYWSKVDLILAAMLSHLLKSDLSIGIAMFQALKSQDSQRAAIVGAAEKALKSEDFRLLQAVWKVTKASRDRRHEYAHHIWGTLDAPEGLVLSDPRDNLRDMATEHDWKIARDKREAEIKKWDDWARIYHPPGPRPAPFSELPPPPVDFANLKLFRKPDLEADVQDARQAHECFVHLHQALWDKYPTQNEARQWLLEVPQIAQALQPPNSEKPCSQPERPPPSDAPC
jgi:hypothetical protein